MHNKTFLFKLTSYLVQNLQQPAACKAFSLNSSVFYKRRASRMQLKSDARNGALKKMVDWLAGICVPCVSGQAAMPCQAP
jgi:hypothetical protein